MSYSKSSKREREDLLKIQQEREGLTQNPARQTDELLKIQQEREKELLKIQQERKVGIRSA